MDSGKNTTGAAYNGNKTDRNQARLPE